jgi:hypothetical protein
MPSQRGRIDDGICADSYAIQALLDIAGESLYANTDNAVRQSAARALEFIYCSSTIHQVVTTIPYTSLRATLIYSSACSGTSEGFPRVRCRLHKEGEECEAKHLSL